MKHIHWVLPLFAGGLMASVHLLPEAGEMEESAISMDLPALSGYWMFFPQPPSPAETEILAPDTRFSKAVCLSARDGEIDLATGLAAPDEKPDRLDLSVVLSGHDLNNSIHRPERCMPSQGHTITNSTDVMLELANGRSLPVKRLISVQSIPTNEEHTEHVNLDCVTYYFFVGKSSITQDHLKRTLLDMKDRLLLGVDQRWAYVSVSLWYGKLPWKEKEVSIGEADAKIRGFLSEFGENQIDWEMIGN
ncbi:exosortase-associated EpsI family protein [Akkermansiaceae bacterium]|nr:exosortase-associated EpsI family protein [Akkermansiaceae bacterium]